MQEDLIAASRRALVLAAALAALPADAVILGEVEVRSALGEALDARIPVGNSDGEMVDASCFSLARDADAPIPVMGEGILTIERSSGAPVLRVRSLARIYEPAVVLRVRAACPGQSGYVLRQYSVLLDPRPGTEVVAGLPVTEARTQGAGADAASSAGTPPRPPAVSAILSARGGESLQSIAAKVFPRDRQARAQYLTALREANPAFAAEGDTQPLPEGAPVALPDLRTFAALDARPRRTRERRDTAVAQAAPAPVRSARARASQPPESRQSAAPAQRTPALSRTATDSGFVLKLSSAQVDLSRSREIDERLRAQLRERLLVLDADDQVSALLAMRNSLRQLETRVAELQLKLAAMPPSLAARTPPPSVAERAQAPTPQPSAASTRPEPPPAAKAVEPKPLEAPAPTPAPASESAAAAPSGAPPPAEAAKAEAASPAAKPGRIARAQPATEAKAPSFWRFDPTPYLWGLVALLAALALLLAYRLRRRRQQEQEYEAVEPELGEADEAAASQFAIAPEPEAARASVDSDANLPTRLQEDPARLRRRYIEERFPEVLSRAIVLDDPDSVVKGARLFYEDGALARAVELLQFAIDENPAEVRPWLALFEIFRLERLTGEFAELAARFRERHGKSEYWRKVQYIGREIDPGNPLYDDASFNRLETIGPSTAKRMAAASFDPIAENWLNAPMDFQNQVLASEMRRALMVDAAVTDQDLAPNPMPALRNVEMYTLA